MKEYLCTIFRYFTLNGTSTQCRKALSKIAEMILTGIIFAIIASLLTANIVEERGLRREINTQLKNLSNVYIGCNKQWADEAFGAPQFVGQKEDYQLCAYVNDYFVLQIAYDQAQAAKAYMITALDNSDGIDVLVSDSTWDNVNGITLGELSYYDFPGVPESVFGFVSNGNARAFYGESYYFMSSGNYYEYYIASFDYGKQGKNAQDFISDLTFPDEEPVDDEVKDSQICTYSLILKDRKRNYPNSYGVSTPDIDMSNLLFSYDWFNSQQLRNKISSVH